MKYLLILLIFISNVSASNNINIFNTSDLLNAFVSSYFEDKDHLSVNSKTIESHVKRYFIIHKIHLHKVISEKSESYIHVIKIQILFNNIIWEIQSTYKEIHINKLWIRRIKLIRNIEELST